MSKTNYRDYTFNIGAGQSMPPIKVQGDYFQVITAAAPLTLSFDNGSSIFAPQGTGGPQDYNDVSVSSSTAQTVTLRLGMTNGLTPYDSRATLAGANLTVSYAVADINAPLLDAVVGAAATAVIAPANAIRRTLLIKLASTAANGIRLGDATVAANKGLLLEPGDTAALETTAAISAYNPGAAAISVSVLELNL